MLAVRAYLHLGVNLVAEELELEQMVEMDLLQVKLVQAV